jgi:hypothetical protein
MIQMTSGGYPTICSLGRNGPASYYVKLMIGIMNHMVATGRFTAYYTIIQYFNGDEQFIALASFVNILKNLTTIIRQGTVCCSGTVLAFL